MIKRSGKINGDDIAIMNFTVSAYTVAVALIIVDGKHTAVNPKALATGGSLTPDAASRRRHAVAPARIQ